MFLLTLSGCDIMLGVQWLGNLDPIHGMEFCYGGRTIKLRGPHQKLIWTEKDFVNLLRWIEGTDFAIKK